MGAVASIDQKTLLNTRLNRASSLCIKATRPKLERKLSMAVVHFKDGPTLTHTHLRRMSAQH